MNKPNTNAKKALSMMKMEIANELGLVYNSKTDKLVDGYYGGMTSRELVKRGEEMLITHYENKKDL